VSLASEGSVPELWGKDLRQEHAAVEDASGEANPEPKSLKTNRAEGAIPRPSEQHDLLSIERFRLRPIPWRFQAAAEPDLRERARQRASELWRTILVRGCERLRLLA
jgi:hypothetical protein